MHKFFGHLHTINHHKRLVMKLCFRCGYYRQGLMHDLSKYAPIEFFKAIAVRMRGIENKTDILPPGFIIKDVTAIIGSIGPN